MGRKLFARLRPVVSLTVLLRPGTTRSTGAGKTIGLDQTSRVCSMSPNGGGEPTGTMLKLIEQNFGSFDQFKEKFSQVAAGHFGSGWAWLVQDPKDLSLQIKGTHDAANPMTDNLHPILTCDVWEHAYYIDYRNDRAKYIQAWWNLVNWDFAEKNLLKSSLQGPCRVTGNSSFISVYSAFEINTTLEPK